MRVGWWVERDGGPAYEREYGAALHAGLQMTGGHPGEGAVTATGRPAQHPDRQVAGRRSGGAGGDGVVARPHRWQHLQVDVERKVDARVIIEELEHRLARPGDLLAISRLA